MRTHPLNAVLIQEEMAYKRYVSMKEDHAECIVISMQKVAMLEGI